MARFKIISDSGVKIAALRKEKNSWAYLTNSYELLHWERSRNGGGRDEPVSGLAELFADKDFSLTKEIWSGV